MVRLDADADRGKVTVSVNGVPVFEDLSTYPATAGSVGLVTHWSPGRFDDIWYNNISPFEPLSLNFAGGVPPGMPVSGTWNASGGTLNSTAVGNTNVATTNCACWETDFRYRARLFNEYGAAGNLVGVVYNYQRDLAQLDISQGRHYNQIPYLGLYKGDYYEVVFAQTGVARLNKVINGARYTLATAAHNVPRNTWFNVEVVRHGLLTSVKLNGTPLFGNVQQGELSYGDVGVVTHWSKARFDNLVVEDSR